MNRMQDKMDKLQRKLHKFSESRTQDESEPTPLKQEPVVIINEGTEPINLGPISRKVRFEIKIKREENENVENALALPRELMPNEEKELISILKNKDVFDDQTGDWDDSRWEFLEHSGPLFPPPYEPLPKNVHFYYNNTKITLS